MRELCETVFEGFSVIFISGHESLLKSKSTHRCFVQAYVPEYLHSVAEFEGPSSPESSYGQAFPGEEEFAKEPAVAPSQLHVTVLGMENSADPDPPLSSSSKPQHVLLNHLFIEKGWPSQQMVAMGLTHRFESKYVTVVLYKPLKKQVLHFCKLIYTTLAYVKRILSRVTSGSAYWKFCRCFLRITRVQ